MFQFDKPQYTLIDLKYIYGALMQIEVKGEDVRILSLLQDKTLNHINQLESLNKVKNFAFAFLGKDTQIKSGYRYFLIKSRIVIRN